MSVEQVLAPNDNCLVARKDELLLRFGYGCTEIGLGTLIKISEIIHTPACQNKEVEDDPRGGVYVLCNFFFFSFFLAMLTRYIYFYTYTEIFTYSYQC